MSTINGAEVKDLLAQLRDAAEVVKGQIVDVDYKIEELLNERHHLCEAPLTKEDFMHYVRKDIQRRASDYPRRMKNLAKGTGFPFSTGFSQLDRIDKAGGGQSLPYLDGLEYSGGSILHQGAMYWIFGDFIEKRFSDALNQFDWPENGISIEERYKRIQEIDQELEQLNEKRDNLASDLMSTGVMQ